MKAVAIIDEPKNCYECPMRKKGEELLSSKCAVDSHIFYDAPYGSRPAKCPLLTFGNDYKKLVKEV